MNAPALRARPHAAPVDLYLTRLQQQGFAGEVGRDTASRLVSATDNSIYQVLPAAVLFPRTGEDLNLAVALAARAEGGPLQLTARGGGTGTNGQSLTAGIVIDTSRHLTRILSLDAAGLKVTVDCSAMSASMPRCRGNSST